ncbi:uncharacterized protein N7496_004645 [Penicillium cataractarum]|uniref:Uncharacterized protein n=1 Tax=Penicillium cataractarum TaxID=2100454 RepID=A0A9W9SEQ2_9EURO|nr:uncharacterized protein N7496_004645 [Penicillium cataractarum]KAJ5377236.1 hypothetical protein N7496_004645 [Penicillium cataractarum]
MHLLAQFIQLRYELIGNLTSWVNNTYYVPPDAMASVMDQAVQDIGVYQSSLGDSYFYIKCNEIKQILCFASFELRRQRIFTRDVARAMDDAVGRLRQIQIS